MATNANCKSSALLVLLVLIGFAMLLMARALPLDVSYVQSHAVERHGEAALTVRECLSKNGAMQVWYNHDTGRLANVCKMADKKFGIQILKEGEGVWEEITSFCKEKMTRIDQIEQYLRNTGYTKIQ